MRAAYGKYQDDGLAVLSVSVQESEQAVVNFIGKYDLAYPFLLDQNGSTAAQYRIYTTPTTYFIGPDGRIISFLPGVVSEQWVDNNMADVRG